MMVNACDGNAEVTSAPVRVVDTPGLRIYYPGFDSVELVCGVMPDTADPSVVMTAEAAFTHEILDHFDHANIDGDHVSGGRLYRGAACKDNSGAFTYYDHRWHFTRGDYADALAQAAAHGGMGFGQALIIYDGQPVEPLWRDGVHEYRALCEKDGWLCIVDSRGAVDYAAFVRMLCDLAPTHALYLDMGFGWNHSWYRAADGTAVEIHPYGHSHCTNWITFYRRPVGR